MSQKKSYTTFWILVAFAAVAAMAVLAYSFSLKQKSDATFQAYDAKAGLGELGARCGGDLRLPCKPGLNCVIPHPLMPTDTGVCSKVSNSEPGKVSPL